MPLRSCGISSLQLRSRWGPTKISSSRLQVVVGQAVARVRVEETAVEAKAAAVGACVAASYVAHFPLLGLIVPRLLELGGVYVCGKAVGRYAEAGSVSLKADLVRVGDEAGDIVKSVLGK